MWNKALGYMAGAWLALVPGMGLAADLVITTGGPSGTYFKFGSQIAELMESYGIEVEVATSGGSVQNLQRLLGYEGVDDTTSGERAYYQLALIQGDVLLELRNHAKGNANLEKIVENIEVVLPLYGEEIHVLAPKSSDYTDTHDLLVNSWTIAGGGAASGTRQTLQSLLRLLDINTESTKGRIADVSGKNALEAIAVSSVETAVMVGGAPMPLLQNDISRESELRLVPLDFPALYKIPNTPYLPAEINSLAYPWMDEPVKTTAVLAMLVAYRYPEGNPNCELIEKTTRAIIDNIDRLKSSGHPKWKEFELRRALERDDVYSCARRGMIQN